VILNFPFSASVPTFESTSQVASFFAGSANTFTAGSTFLSPTFARYTPSADT